MDSIWQLTGTNPTKIEAKVDRAIRDESSAKPKPSVFPNPIKSPQNGSGARPEQKDQVEKDDQADSKPLPRLSRHATMLFPPDQRKSDFVQRMD